MHTQTPRRRRFKRQLDSVIIHFDYDCFYASVFENENPALRTLPLAVQQKQIVVTCNYEARRRGLYKLQLIKEAKRLCPDVVIVLGEDLTRFRNASKDLYAFLTAFSWNQKVERLGFDEVFMDVSDIIDYNVDLLNHNDLINSFFCLSKNDPAVGFAYDASSVAGSTYPEASNAPNTSDAPLDYELELRLRLGSHLANHLREALYSQKGYTCTVGISTNKLLSKLVGNVHKPCNQTTLLPPYTLEDGDILDSVTPFMDNHEVGKVPGIGFKLAQKLRAHVLQRQPEYNEGLVYGGTKEAVTVKDVRTYSGMSAEALERILGGPGMPHGVGARVWDLLNGCDDSEVGQARAVPTQISLEDSYIRLDSISEVVTELRTLGKSLIRRMRTDLLEDDDGPLLGDTTTTTTLAPAPTTATDTTTATATATTPTVIATTATTSIAKKRWLAFPKTIRLTTRPRAPQNPDGSRYRLNGRISRSGPMPNFVFNLKEPVDSLVERLVMETLLPLFRKLHPEPSGWNLSLVNIAAANMIEGSSDKGGVGRDIAKMFARQDDVLKEFRVQKEPADVTVDDDHFDDDRHSYKVVANIQQDERKSSVATGLTASNARNRPLHSLDEKVGAHEDDATLAQRTADQPDRKFGSEDIPTPSQENSAWDEDTWESDEDMVDDDTFRCDVCGAVMPIFAVAAHGRWHEQS